VIVLEVKMGAVTSKQGKKGKKTSLALSEEKKIITQQIPEKKKREVPTQFFLLFVLGEYGRNEETYLPFDIILAIMRIYMLECSESMSFDYFEVQTFLGQTLRGIFLV
jgi:hypothetical protein